MADRRTFLRGLVSLPLIGGGVTLIGQPAAAVPLVQAAALPTFDDPRQRARYAWEAFSAAMLDLTAGADGWRVNGAGAMRMPFDRDAVTYCHLAEVSFDVSREPATSRRPGLVVERHREIHL